MCDLAVVAAVGVHDIELPYAAVLLYAGVSYPVEDPAAVRGELWVGYSSEAQHYFRCELAVHDFDRDFFDDCGRAFPAALGVGGHHCQ